MFAINDIEFLLEQWTNGINVRYCYFAIKNKKQTFIIFESKEIELWDGLFELFAI